MSEEIQDEAKEKKGWFKRLSEGLKKTSNKITTGISDLIHKRKLDSETLQELEDLLITTDMGIETAEKIIAELKKNRFEQEISEIELKEFIAEELEKILLQIEKPFTLRSSQKPLVMMMVGVNGSGKTTTIGKIASEWVDAGLKLSIAACDTFRAAAVDQLKQWSDNAGANLISTMSGGDAAGLAYDAFIMARNRKDDVLIIDTAGRLHNRSDLMAELEKIYRVLKKQDPEAPHNCLLVLDATTGQNAYAQVEAFKKMTHVSGLIMTKLDGTAKGGVVVGLAQKFGLPLHVIGVGESPEDLQPFEAKVFARSLMGLDNFIEKTN